MAVMEMAIKPAESCDAFGPTGDAEGLQKAFVDLRRAAPAYREAMHRRWNAFIGATTPGKGDATIEPLQARPQSYGCFELHEDPDYWENRVSHTISACPSCGWSATVTEPDKRHFVPNGQKHVNRFKALWREFLLRKKRVIEFRVRPYLLPRKVKHIHGPRNVSYALDELLVISVVRNGELHVKSFLNHYRSMGVRHFVFLDNGSTDRTLDMLCAEEEVTVLQTEAPYNKYENTMKRYLAERFSSGRWNLCADIDELFDYPFSERLSLRDFLSYLNKNHYTAVVAQMLDMFSEVPLGKFNSKPDDKLKEKYRFYDISTIDKEDYLWSERSNPDIKMHWGGVRKTVFGTNNGLTKSPLVFMDGKVRPFITWHHPKGARMADISCVLMHYPFVGSFYAKVKDAAQTGRYGMRVTDEYRGYLRTLEGNANLNLKFASARGFTGLEQLIEEQFLIVSGKYRQWVDDHAQ